MLIRVTVIDQDSALHYLVCFVNFLDMLETGVSESVHAQPHERDPIKLKVFGNNQSALYQAVTTADVNTQPANGGESLMLGRWDSRLYFVL